MGSAPSPVAVTVPVMTTNRRPGLLLTLAVSGLLLSACVPATGAEQHDAPAAASAGTAHGPNTAAKPSHKTSPKSSTKPSSGTAAQALATLTVKGRAPMTGYSRDQFGPAWADVDRNGCDTRIICSGEAEQVAA